MNTWYDIMIWYDMLWKWYDDSLWYDMIDMKWNGLKWNDNMIRYDLILWYDMALHDLKWYEYDMN